MSLPIDQIICGDCLEEMKKLPSESVDCCVTSPPYYGLRDYGVAGQIGLEASPKEYVARLVEVFREVRRVLKPEGTLWLNLGDSYAGSSGCHKGGSEKANSNAGATSSYIPPKPGKPKDLIGIPWMVAFALRADGWYLRSDIIWHKPNCMPESVTDRPTKAHEYIFLLSKSERYFYDNEAIQEKAFFDGRKDTRYKGSSKYANQDNPVHSVNTKDIDGSERWPNQKDGIALRNKRTVWTIATKPFPGSHFAVMPESLVEPCILAGCPEGGIVLDPFFGAGTVGAVAKRLGRKYIGIELNPDYIEIAQTRIAAIPARLDKWGLA